MGSQTSFIFRRYLISHQEPIYSVFPEQEALVIGSFQTNIMKKFIITLIGMFLIGISIILFLSLAFAKDINVTLPKVIVFAVVLILGISIGGYFIVIGNTAEK